VRVKGVCGRDFESMRQLITHIAKGGCVRCINWYASTYRVK
jgi:hypothetical protein